MEELLRLWNDITSSSTSWLGGFFYQRDQDSSSSPLHGSTAGSAAAVLQPPQHDDDHLVSLDAPRHRHRRQLGYYSAIYDLSQEVIRCHVSIEKEIVEPLSPLTSPPTPPSPLLSPPAAPQPSIIQPVLPILRRIPYMPAIQEGPPEAEISIAYMSDQTEVSVVRHMTVSPLQQEEDEMEGEVDIAEIDLPPIDSLPRPLLSSFKRSFRGLIDQAGAQLEQAYDDEVLMPGEYLEEREKAATRIKEESKDEKIEESEEDDDEEGGVDGGDSISLPDIVPFS